MSAELVKAVQAISEALARTGTLSPRQCIDLSERAHRTVLTYECSRGGYISSLTGAVVDGPELFKVRETMDPVRMAAILEKVLGVDLGVGNRPSSEYTYKGVPLPPPNVQPERGAVSSPEPIYVDATPVPPKEPEP